MPGLAFAQAQTALDPPLRVRAEFRERMEVFDGSGFNASRDDLYWLTRFRLNAIVAPSKLLSFQFQAQDARVAQKTVGTHRASLQGATRPAYGICRSRRS